MWKALKTKVQEAASPYIEEIVREAEEREQKRKLREQQFSTLKAQQQFGQGQEWDNSKEVATKQERDDAYYQSHWQENGNEDTSMMASAEAMFSSPGPQSAGLAASTFDSPPPVSGDHGTYEHNDYYSTAAREEENGFMTYLEPSSEANEAAYLNPSSSEFVENDGSVEFFQANKDQEMEGEFEYMGEAYGGTVEDNGEDVVEEVRLDNPTPVIDEVHPSQSLTKATEMDEISISATDGSSEIMNRNRDLSPYESLNTNGLVSIDLSDSTVGDIAPANQEKRRNVDQRLGSNDSPLSAAMRGTFHHLSKLKEITAQAVASPVRTVLPETGNAQRGSDIRDEVETTIRNLTRELSEWKPKREFTKEDVEALDAKAIKLWEHLKDRAQRSMPENEDNDAKKIKDLRRQFAASESARQDLQRENERAQLIQAELKNRTLMLERQLEHYQTTIAAMEERERDKDRKIEQLTQQIESQNQRNEGEITRLRNENQSLQERLVSERKSAEAELETMRQTIDQTLLEHDSKQFSSRELAEAVTNLNDEIALLESQLDDAREKLSALQLKHQALQDLKMQSVEEQLKQLEDSQWNASEDEQQFSERSNRLRKHISQARQRYRELTIQGNAKSSALEKLRKGSNELENLLARIEESIRSMCETQATVDSEIHTQTSSIYQRLASLLGETSLAPLKELLDTGKQHPQAVAQASADMIGSLNVTLIGILLDQVLERRKQKAWETISQQVRNSTTGSLDGDRVSATKDFIEYVGRLVAEDNQTRGLDAHHLVEVLETLEREPSDVDLSEVGLGILALCSSASIPKLPEPSEPLEDIHSGLLQNEGKAKTPEFFGDFVRQCAYNVVHHSQMHASLENHVWNLVLLSLRALGMVLSHKVDSSKEKSSEKLQEGENDMVDKRFVASVVVTCLERNCRMDCLEVVASVLGFTPEERKRVGLDHQQGLLASFIPDWTRGQAKAEQTDFQNKSFTSMVADFIRDETS